MFIFNRYYWMIKKYFFLLLWCELVLLCCVCNCEFKYLQDEYIKNTNIIWHQTLFYTNRNNDRSYIIWGYISGICLSVYSSDYGNCSSSPWYYSWYSLIWIYRWNFSIGIFKRLWEPFPFSLALLMIFIIYEDIDKMCLSVYFSDYENCFPYSWHYLWCSLYTCIPIECVHRYIPETMRTIPFLPSTVHKVHYIWVNRWNAFVVIFQRL